MLEIVGYGDRLSLRPGDSLAVMVSCEGGADRFRAQVVRLICGDDGPDGPGFKEESVASTANGDYPGRRQPIETGSYVIVPAAGPLPELAGFTLQALIWPTTPRKGPQTLLGRWSEPQQSGFALAIDAGGAAALKLGDGRGGAETISAGKPLVERSWYFVAASYDPASGEVRVLQEPLVWQAREESGATVARQAGVRPRPEPETPFMMAAHIAGRRGGRLLAGGFYNGKLEAPRLAARPLARAEMEALRNSPPSQLGGTVVGAWDFAQAISSDRIVDLSENGLHGTAVNLPARGMTGSLWTGEAMCWGERPAHYGAIHFHEDDLYDAGWEVDLRVPVQETWRSGIYAVRLRSGEAGEDYVPFFVLPPRGKATAPVAFLAPTATYMAYANSHHGWDDPLSEICYGRLLELGPTELFLNERHDFGMSTYDLHSDGSGVCYSSRLRPILNARPKRALWNFNADLHITDWLEAIGQPYDVITDEDLHEEGLALLGGYRVVVTGTHPEYHSRSMLAALEGYLAGGGRLIYLGGNGFYWRIAFHPEKPGVIEVRRAETGTRCWAAEPGEYAMSFSGEPGGLWRSLGFPPQRLVGVGYASEGFDVSSFYRRLPDSFDPRVAFIFEGIGAEERIGDFGRVGGGAAGLELDVMDTALGTPRHALRLAQSENHSNVYLLTPEELISTYPGIDGIENARVRADMLFFETPKGGAVFSTGSIAWAGSLAHGGYRNNVARITGNVLRRFLDPTPF